MAHRGGSRVEHGCLEHKRLLRYLHRQRQVICKNTINLPSPSDNHYRSATFSLLGFNWELFSPKAMKTTHGCLRHKGKYAGEDNLIMHYTYVRKQPEIHLLLLGLKKAVEMFREPVWSISSYTLKYHLLLEAIVKHANMEYRLGNKEVACSVYETVISAEQAKEHSQILPLLVVQYSRFLSLVVGDSQKAREILYGSLDRMQVSKPLLEAIIHLESIQPSPKDVGKLDSLVDKYITPNSDNSIMASTTDREEISCIFMEFLDLFGDAQSIEKADNRHNMLFLRQKSTSVSKKRRAEDFLASDKAKLIKSDISVPTSAQSVMGAYPNAQNQWSAGCGQKPPTWPQTSQAQGQQWNPGYTQQGGYSAYGGYANYSKPQSAAYAAYPAQAYPQQTYPQAAVAATFPQQQTQIFRRTPSRRTPSSSSSAILYRLLLRSKALQLKST